MADFDVGDAALSGLRLITRKPKVLPYWMGFNALVAACALAVFFLVFGGFLQQVRDLAINSGEPSPGLFLSLIPRIGLMVLVFLPLGLLVAAIRRSAATRAILWPEDDRFGYLRVGADEFRLMLVILVLNLIRVAVQIVVGIIIGILIVIVAGVSGGLRSGGAGSFQAVQQLFQLPTYAVLLFFFLKLCLATPQTMDTKAINIFGSWELTNGHTGRMLLSYLLVGLIAFGFALLTAALVIGFVIAAGGGALMTIIPQMKTDPAGAIRAIFNLIIPISVAFAVIGSIMQPFFTALIYCPAAYIYGHIMGRAEEAF